MQLWEIIITKAAPKVLNKRIRFDWINYNNYARTKGCKPAKIRLDKNHFGEFPVDRLTQN